MDIGSILIGLALAIAVGAFVIRPLLEGGGESITEVDRRLSELQAERDRVLTRIQELDMDFSMGKVLEANYRGQRDELMLRGVEILKELDANVGIEASPSQPAGLEDEIEAAVARFRSGGRAEGRAFCPSCGEQVQSGDRFCTHCGSALSEQEAQT